MLHTQTYERKTFVVEAVQVTLQNFPDVIQWVNDNGGRATLSRDVQHRPYVAVDVQRPLNEKQTMAYEGDWILKASTGFRIYNDRAFHKSFERTEKTLTGHPDPYQLGNVFDRPGATPVVERPVGKEKEVQPDSVEKVAVNLQVDSAVMAPGVAFEEEALIPEKNIQGRRQVELEYGHPGEKEFGTPQPVTPFVRTPEQIREAHRTGAPGRSLAESNQYREEFRRQHGRYPGQSPAEQDRTLTFGPGGREAFRNLYGHYPEESPLSDRIFLDGTPVLQVELEEGTIIGTDGRVDTGLEVYRQTHGHYPGENVDQPDA